jgi:isoquinoline 1-oxidoreductase beta subunit
MKDQNIISRRSFIRNVSIASGGLILACNVPDDKKEIGRISENLTDFNPNLFVQLKSNGDLILTASRSEMGQGVRTSLTSVIADEMDADWNRVKVKQAPGDDAYGNQNTDGSRSIRTIYEPMRQMGAMARTMLITAAANKWGIESSECKTENHYVINTTNDEKLFYGDLVEEASKLAVPTNIELKSPEEFVYIGKGLKSVDVNDFTYGKAKYGLDIRLPNMKYACIARCPVTFGKVKSFEKSKALSIDGVIDIIEVPRIEKPFGALGGVAVIANNTWAALKGKEVLEINWDLGDNKDYTSENYMKGLTDNVLKKGKQVKNEGNVNSAFKKAKKVIESTYELPHLVHAPMEMPNATASFNENKCEVWAPVQAPQTTRKEISDYLEIDLKDITVNVTFLGGGFGRKSKPDFVLEAVLLSKKINTPVQVIWTREDDIQHSYYHAVSSQYMKGSLDENGNVTGWLHRTAYPSITSTFMPGVKHGAGFEFQQGLTNIPYEIKNILCENGEAIAHVRIGWLRSVYNIIHGFSVNVFADELAVAAKKDPLQFRLDLIGSDRMYPSDNEYKMDTSRLKNVLKIAANNAVWGKDLPKGHGLGLAVHYSFYSYVASVVEVSVIDEKLKIHNVYTAVDCGTVVNTNTVKAQLEGAAIFGMSLAFYGKITAKNGAIEQSNYHDYKMLRINEAPNIQIEIVKSKDIPTGIGEPGVPVIAPAIINAIYDATGKRYKNLPLSEYGLV